MATAPAPHASKIESILSVASRRHLFVLAVEQFALLFSVLFAAVILLLLLGTQILSPYWILPLVCAALILSLIRVQARLLSRYRIAQLVDTRLHLQDTLSTACFLIQSPHARALPFAGQQIVRAEELAQSVHPAVAFPLVGRRGWALAGALAAVAFGLFAVRYLVTDSLSLRTSLIPLRIAPVLDRSETAGGKSPQQTRTGPDSNKGGQQRRSADPQTGRDASATPELAEIKTGEKGDANAQKSTTQRAASGADKAKDGRDASQNSAPATQPSADGQTQGTERASSTPEANSKPDAQSATGPQNSAGLVDKMKDALSSLMEKMRPNQASGKPGQTGDRKSDEAKSQDQLASSKGSGQAQSQNGQSQKSGEEQNSDGQAQGQTTEKTQAGQGHSADSANEKGADAHSGVGRQDGDKSLREAEQLRAMGKLAEIIGKRSANLTGEMTVETPSGKQQLKTAYSQRVGHHQDSGGEINHDEIPLADQQYVRDYMEQVHKDPKAKQP